MTAELWTPGGSATKSADGLQLWIPEEARGTIYVCRVCQKRFPESQFSQWKRHVQACAKSHRDEHLEQIEERRQNVILSPGDRERFEYVRKNPRNRGVKSKHLKGLVG